MKTTSCLEHVELTPELLERMAQVLKLLAHPQRLKLIDVLERMGQAPVHELVRMVGAPQAVISLHLNQMRRMGLVACERRGQEVWYRIEDPRSLTILDCIRSKGGKA